MRIYTKKPLYMLKQTCARASTFTLNYFAMKFTFRRHETQLILYDGAKEMLRRAKIDPRTLDLDKLRADFSKMELQKKELLQACQSAEKRSDRWSVNWRNWSSILVRNEMMNQNIKK